MKGLRLTIASLIAGAALFTLPVTAAEKPVDLNALLSQVKAASTSESQLNKEREARFLADKNEQGALLAKAKAEWERRLNECPAEHRPYLVVQYATPVRNQYRVKAGIPL